MIARCPKCGRTGLLEGLTIGVANDNLITVAMAKAVEVPEGFRVIVFGWQSPYEHLCCMQCGVPAERASAW